MKHQTTLVLALSSLLACPALSEEAQAEATVVVEAQAIEVVVVDKQAPAAEAKQEATAADKTEEAKPAAKEQAGEAAAEAPAKTEQSEADLRKKMRELERELQEARSEFQQKADKERRKVQEDATKAIQDIKLPKNPTRKQCEDFVAELRKATEGRRSFSSSDPVTTKLKEIPAEHFDLLIKEMTDRTPLRYYANYAMREIDPEKLRKRFVNSLDENPNNIGIIVMHGWTEDVREQVIQHMQGADNSITPAWFQAAVEIDEPSLYPKLHEITTTSRYASQFVSMLEMLPEYDLAHTVDVCWRKAREGKLSVSYTTFASKAAEFGNVDALGVLVDQLRSTSSYLSHSSTYNMRRTNVLRHIDYRGSNQDIQKWFRTNKDKLVFDEFRKRFVVQEDF